MAMAVPLVIFVGLGVFIWVLYRSRKQRESGVARFQKQAGLVYLRNRPESLAARFKNVNASCHIGVLSNGIAFQWWTWYTAEHQGSSVAFDYRVTIALPGNGIAEASKRAAIAAASSHKDGFFKRTFTTPVAAEALPDGTFLITWHIVMEQADRLAAILDWLDTNIEAPHGSAQDEYLIRTFARP
jgi:hypothetical protein